MGWAISEDLKCRIVLIYETDGLTMEVISKVVHFHQLHGQVTNPFSHHTGCPSVLKNDDLQFISTILDANPGLYLDEVQDKLVNVHDIHVSIATTAYDGIYQQKFEVLHIFRSLCIISTFYLNFCVTNEVHI